MQTNKRRRQRSPTYEPPTPELAAAAAAFARVHRLSPRETEVVTWMAAGHIGAELLAAILGITENTVHNHNKSVMKRVGVNTRAGVIAALLRHALSGAAVPKGRSARPRAVPLTVADAIKPTGPAITEIREGLSDKQWARVRNVIAINQGTMKLLSYPGARRFVEAVVYRVTTGCAWRMLPKSYGSWPALHLRFQKWRRHDGLWDEIFAALRLKRRQAE